MKLIIIEGRDRTGKSTVISNIMDNWIDNTAIFTIIKSGKPVNTDKEKAAFESDALNRSLINKIINNIFDESAVIIMNRSWYSEYVYGHLYRNRDLITLNNIIEELETKLLNSKIDVKLILLENTSNELSIKNEDGKSYSNTIDNIEKERTLFNDIFNKSKLNKIKINVNIDNNWKSFDDIQKEVMNFI